MEVDNHHLVVFRTIPYLR
ncbi:hypothetical protein FMJ32_29085 [Klebsiella michiganensis]|nr:hypothetical protein [Klebsiella michiganensis]MBZ7451593.1 hypothetical protein [Klebsiella michiganensis]MBZ7453475.1 hypothetical protein [Klebsiella michiganensis]